MAKYNHGVDSNARGGKPKAKGKFGKMSMLGLGINAMFSVSDYKYARESGASTMGAVASAGATFAAGEVLGGWMLPAMLAKELPGALVSGAESLGKVQRSMDMNARPIPFAGTNFNDHQQAYTMRQAGMQIAQQSQYNLQQSMLGQEATYLR